MNSSYVLFSEGCYSDYQNTAFAVLRSFTMEDVTLLFLHQWKPRYDFQTKPKFKEFLHWMNINGYIRDADEIPEIHLGEYDFDPESIGTELMHHRFTPAKEQEMNKETECTEQPVDYSSTVIANIVEVLTGTQSTTMDISGASSVKHLSLVTQHTMSLVELELFFREHR